MAVLGLAVATTACTGAASSTAPAVAPISGQAIPPLVLPLDGYVNRLEQGQTGRYYRLSISKPDVKANAGPRPPDAAFFELTMMRDSAYPNDPPTTDAHTSTTTGRTGGEEEVAVRNTTGKIWGVSGLGNGPGKAVGLTGCVQWRESPEAIAELCFVRANVPSDVSTQDPHALLLDTANALRPPSAGEWLRLQKGMPQATGLQTGAFQATTLPGAKVSVASYGETSSGLREYVEMPGAAPDDFEVNISRRSAGAAGPTTTQPIGIVDDLPFLPVGTGPSTSGREPRIASMTRNAALTTDLGVAVQDVVQLRYPIERKAEARALLGSLHNANDDEVVAMLAVTPAPVVSEKNPLPPNFTSFRRVP